MHTVYQQQRYRCARSSVVRCLFRSRRWVDGMLCSAPGPWNPQRAARGERWAAAKGLNHKEASTMEAMTRRRWILATAALPAALAACDVAGPASPGGTPGKK